MATPRTLKKLEDSKAKALIDKHLKADTGWWEGAPEYSDFVYEARGKRKLIRPGISGWETGIVVM